MDKIREFSSGYIKTILFAIEYKPRFQFPQQFFIIPHFIHHIQLLGLFMEISHDQVFDYIVVLVHYTLIEPMLSYDLSLIFFFIIFSFQIILLSYLLIATLETQRVSLNFKLRIILEKKIETINQVLHWYFTFYSIFTIPFVIISVKFMTSSYQVLSYINACLQYFQGVILIYLLRNHRFAENNSFKRRFAYVQLVNYTISYILIFFRYFQDLFIPKFFLGFAYCIFAIIDQFYSCPYRDPFREPSLKIGMILLATVIINFLYQENIIQREGQLFWTLFVCGLISGTAGSISALFHEFAMSNYNSRFNLQEKYIIIGVDQFYSHFIHFQTSDYNKLVFFQLLIKHSENCLRSKCPSSSQKLRNINVNDKKQLEKLTIDIVSCIFKTCHSRSVVKNGEIHKPKFEQLQLQYISFLSQIAQRPLIGYVELRRYQQNQNNDNSLYFRELTSKISSELEFQILYLQERMIQQQFRKEKFMANDEKLSIAQLWRSVNCYQEITPKIIEVIEKKQKFWDNLIEGYDDLEPFHKEQLKLCQAIHELYESIKTTIVIPEVFFDRSKDISVLTILRNLDPEDRNINILNLKMYSILFSVILNDFDRAFQAEKQIDELIKEDRQKSVEVIDDCALLKDDAVIILVSLVRKKGHIINKNLLTLANFFDFQNVQDIASQTLISSFLPQDLRLLHDAQMNEFVSKGFTKYSVQSIHSYFVQKKGYLRECYIKIGNLFQDSTDFILTSSILKLQPSYDIVMFDSYGKILGVSEDFFEKRVQSNNPLYSLEKFIDQGHIFAIIPYILINMRKLINETECEFVDFAYFSEMLEDCNFQYCQMFFDRQKVEQKLSSYNLTTIKSQILTHASAVSGQSFNDDQVKIKGNNIPILQQDKMLACLEFLLKYYTDRDFASNIQKVKYTIRSEIMESKKEKLPYFICKIEPLSEFESSDTNKTLTFTKSIKRALITLKYGESQTGIDSTNTKNQMGKTLQYCPDESIVKKQNEIIQEIDIVNETTDLKPPSDQNVSDQQMQLDISALPQKEDETKVIFENPQISMMEDQDFSQLVQQIEDSKMIQENHQQEQFEDPKYDSDLIEKKSNSSKERTKKNNNNIIDILRKNKIEKELLDHENQQQSSKPSSQKTSSSKSPYLLIRSLYQFTEINNQIWLIILLNVLVCATTFLLLFIKVFIVQNQFGVLQSNLNYVQNPEKVNNYFLKTLMLSSNNLQQKYNLANYSTMINMAINTEFNELAKTIEPDLKSIYEDIITFEKEVIPLNEDLQIINGLKNFDIIFDLTILLEQIASNAIALQQYFEGDFNQNSLSLFLFFRLNMVQVITISKSYISYLNENLIFYEQQIINVLTYVIVSELCLISVLILFTIKVLQDINSFIRRILILVTKLSEEDVNQINKVYQEIKMILKDPKQIQWKQTNYVRCVFETNIVKVRQELNSISVAASSSTTSKQRKKRYQNSSLTSRVYNLRLPQIWNFAFLFISWLFFAAYLLGALGLSISMVSSVKPAIALNLQLIEFKLKFDSLIVYGETLKTDYLLRQALLQEYDISAINFNLDIVYTEFNSLQDGFLNSLSIIYNQLTSSDSLMSDQKTTLIQPFQTSLCVTYPQLIPACTQRFNAYMSDNSVDYVSGGIVNMVQEFSKTLITFWSSYTNITDPDTLNQFLSSQVHTTEFVHHFLYQGKILELIATTMLNLNKNTLDSVIVQFSIYIYVLGLVLIISFVLFFYKWVSKIDNKMYLTKLALTLIPSDSLNEQKTMTELKNIQSD